MKLPSLSVEFSATSQLPLSSARAPSFSLEPFLSTLHGSSSALWDAATGQCIRTFADSGYVSFCYAPSIAAAGAIILSLKNNQLQLYDKAGNQIASALLLQELEIFTYTYANTNKLAFWRASRASLSASPVTIVTF